MKKLIAICYLLIGCSITLLAQVTELRVDANGNLLPNTKVIFKSTSTHAGLNPGSVAGNPSTLANGDLWYNSLTNQLDARINGANVALGGGGGGSGLTGGTTGDLIIASGATTIADSGVSLTDVARKSLSLSQFTGTNLNQIGTRNFSDLQNIPTTSESYGITNGVVVTHKNGTTTTYTPTADTDSARGTALLNAAAALVAYDVARLSGGNFDLGNNGFIMPVSTVLKGIGAGQTVITSSAPLGGGAGGVVALSSNSRIESLSLNATGSGAAPLGLVDNTGITNVVIDDCIISGVIDGLYNTIGTNNSIRFYNTKLLSTYDAVNWYRGTAEFFDCDIVVTGPHGTDFARGVVSGLAGNIFFYGGSITVNGSTSENAAFEALSSGTIEAHNVRVKVGTSATNNWDINGNVNYNNVTRSDGAALVINGSGSLRLSRSASRDNNLSDLTNFVAARNNIGLGNGTSNGQIPIWDNSLAKFVPGDPLVQGLTPEGSTSAVNPINIGGFDKAGTPAIHGANVENAAPGASDYGVVTRNIPSGTQPVSGTFWQATQPVSGTFWQATQPVSGTFWQATQPVSNAGTFAVQDQQSNITADYDSGAGTQTMTMFGIALPASGGSVAGGTSTNPIRVDPIGTTTQPVSGTFWQTTQPVSVAAGATNIAKAEDVASADADVGVPAMAIRKATPANTSGTDGDYEMLQMSAGRVWVSALIDSALPAGANTIGAVTQASGPWTENQTQINGSAVVTSATGVQKVGIVGNTNSTLDSAIGGATAPANDLAVGGIYNNATPISPSDTQAASFQIDQMGNLRVFSGIALKTLSAQSATLNATQTIYSNSGARAVLVQLTETTTLTAGAITFEVSFDNSNWITIPADCVLDPTSTTFAQISLPYTVQASTNKQFLLLTKGAQGLRIKTSTAITGTGSVTPNYALLDYSPAQYVLALSPTAANFNITVGAALPTGANTIGAVTQASGPWTENQTQINGSAVVTSAAGVQKVGVVGNAGAAVDAATNAAPPANGVLDLGISAIALPTAVTATNTAGKMVDKFGRQVFLPQAPRDLIGTFAVQTTNTTQTALIAAAGSGVFADISQLTITNEGSTATIISLSDGTTTYKYSIQGTAGAGVVLSFSPPLPGTTANTAWNVTSSATATIDYAGNYVKNK